MEFKLPKPTPDQEAYLRQIHEATGKYDPLVVVGGPRPLVTDEMIQAACTAGYGVGTDKDSNLYKLMKRALAAGIAARR